MRRFVGLRDTGYGKFFRSLEKFGCMNYVKFVWKAVVATYFIVILYCELGLQVGHERNIGIS